MGIFFLILIMILVYVSLGLKIIPKDVRGCVFRFRKFHRVVGPGLVFVWCFFESIDEINLTDEVPDWRGLDDNEIYNAVRWHAIDKRAKAEDARLQAIIESDSKAPRIEGNSFIIIIDRVDMWVLGRTAVCTGKVVQGNVKRKDKVVLRFSDSTEIQDQITRIEENGHRVSNSSSPRCTVYLKNTSKHVIASHLNIPPSKLRIRYASAFIDLAVWTLITFAGLVLVDKIVRDSMGNPVPTGPDPRDSITTISYGIAVICANQYLTISAATGRSLGKILFGLKVVVADTTAEPGLVRGLIRSSLQAPPYMGALMVWTGLHDSFAGTQIVKVHSNEIKKNIAATVDLKKRKVAIWKIVLATILHLFSGFVYMILGNI